MTEQREVKMATLSLELNCKSHLAGESGPFFFFFPFGDLAAPDTDRQHVRIPLRPKGIR